MSETQLVPNLTADEAKELRSRLRAYTWTQRKLAEERKARRAERAEEIERHRIALLVADENIAKSGAGINELDKQLGVLREQMRTLRSQIADAEGMREECVQEREKAYRNRNAARDALKKLRAEIRGENGEEVPHVQACE